MNTLTDIGIKYRTDKATFHNFTPIYENVLNHLRNEKIKFLEIGIWMGSSLKMWEEYFPNAEIYGADVRTEEVIKELQQTHDNGSFKDNIFDEKKTKILCVDQEKVEDLTGLSDDWDVILDDGGHTMLQQQLSLKILFDKVKSKGVYIIEDLHTSYYPDFGATDNNNTIRLLNDLKNKKISPNSQYFIDEKDFEKLIESIESVEIYAVKPVSIPSVSVKK
jgi:hypothetical protein